MSDPIPLRVRQWSAGPVRDGIYQGVTISWTSGRRNRTATVQISHTGRSVYVTVDGKRFKEATDE